MRELWHKASATSRLASILVLSAALAAGTLGTACEEASSPAGAEVRPSFLLVSLPSLGTATWRCGPKDDTYGLAFRVFSSGATTSVRLLAARRVVRRVTVHPGETYRFPVLGLSQRLKITQGTGAGTLRATVGARFDKAPVVSHCFAYSPPHLIVRVSTRR